jgi:hypothetical protein
MMKDLVISQSHTISSGIAAAMIIKRYAVEMIVLGGNVVPVKNQIEGCHLPNDSSQRCAENRVGGDS